MSRIAILGATSQIAKDLIQSFAANSVDPLALFARRPQAVAQWLASVDLSERYSVHGYADFNVDDHFDAILNFVGVSNPVQAAAMGASIFDVTLTYDELALNYVRQCPACRYIFLSSGAAYGASFDTPVDANTKATVPINNLQPQDWYGVAKLHAECRHRALAPLPIVDIRIFNYFSHTQDMDARFLITDIVRAIRNHTVLNTSADYILRDFIHPYDFYKLINAVLAASATNAVIDAYSKEPIDKTSLLTVMHENFGLQYEITEASSDINATGYKKNYCSANLSATAFGYQPHFTSAECILNECSKLFSSLVIRKA